MLQGSDERLLYFATGLIRWNYMSGQNPVWMEVMFNRCLRIPAPSQSNSYLACPPKDSSLELRGETWYGCSDLETADAVAVSVARSRRTIAYMCGQTSLEGTLFESDMSQPFACCMKVYKS